MAHVQTELAQITDQYADNKDEVIGLLLDKVLDVQLEVPRVVRLKIKTAAEEWDDTV